MSLTQDTDIDVDLVDPNATELNVASSVNETAATVNLKRSKSDLRGTKKRQLLSYTEDDNNCDDEKELIISSPKSIESINPSTTSDLKKLSHDPILLPVTPIQPSCSSWKVLPPEPKLLVFVSPGPESSKVIGLRWDYITNDNFARVKNYEIFSLRATTIREAIDTNKVTDNWMKIDDIKARKLPMACAFCHCKPGNIFFFAVRAIDEYDRPGPFSNVSKATV